MLMRLRTRPSAGHMGLHVPVSLVGLIVSPPPLLGSTLEVDMRVLERRLRFPRQFMLGTTVVDRARQKHWRREGASRSALKICSHVNEK